MGDRVRELMAARLSRVLWTIVKTLYSILSAKGNLLERGLKRSHISGLHFQKITLALVWRTGSERQGWKHCGALEVCWA